MFGRYWFQEIIHIWRARHKLVQGVCALQSCEKAVEGGSSLCADHVAIVVESTISVQVALFDGVHHLSSCNHPKRLHLMQGVVALLPLPPLQAKDDTLHPMQGVVAISVAGEAAGTEGGTGSVDGGQTVEKVKEEDEEPNKLLLPSTSAVEKVKEEDEEPNKLLLPSTSGRLGKKRGKYKTKKRMQEQSQHLGVEVREVIRLVQKSTNSLLAQL
jgi:hypothetical protein